MGNGARIQARFNAWLLRVGQVRVVIAITVVAALLSVVMTGLANVIFMPQVPWEEWFYVSLIVPVIISPIVSSWVLSLLYQLAEARAALVKMSETDPLTGMGNRRHFFSAGEHALTAAMAGGKPTSVVLVDIDHFKRLNDSFGHAVGDAALIAVANTCRQSLREADVFCRWGGEEFIALLPSADLKEACSVAERLRKNVEQTDIPGIAERVTVSIGVAQVLDPTAPLDDAIIAADQQLYAAKDAGRNRVEPGVGSGGRG